MRKSSIMKRNVGISVINKISEQNFNGNGNGNIEPSKKEFNNFMQNQNEKNNAN
jgi:hypothetical protein